MVEELKLGGWKPIGWAESGKQRWENAEGSSVYVGVELAWDVMTCRELGPLKVEFSRMGENVGDSEAGGKKSNDAGEWHKLPSSANVSIERKAKDLVEAGWRFYWGHGWISAEGAQQWYYTEDAWGAMRDIRLRGAGKGPWEWPKRASTPNEEIVRKGEDLGAAGWTFDCARGWASPGGVRRRLLTEDAWTTMVLEWLKGEGWDNSCGAWRSPVTNLYYRSFDAAWWTLTKPAGPMTMEEVHKALIVGGWWFSVDGRWRLPQSTGDYDMIDAYRLMKNRQEKAATESLAKMRIPPAGETRVEELEKALHGIKDLADRYYLANRSGVYSPTYIKPEDGPSAPFFRISEMAKLALAGK